MIGGRTEMKDEETTMCLDSLVRDAESMCVKLRCRFEYQSERCKVIIP